MPEWRGGGSVLNHKGCGALSGDMVFLLQADAVVVAATAGHGVFLRQAQAGQGLAGVQQFYLGA